MVVKNKFLVLLIYTIVNHLLLLEIAGFYFWCESLISEVSEKADGLIVKASVNYVYEERGFLDILQVNVVYDPDIG